MVTQDDNKLIREVLEGNISSFELLIDTYQKPVYNLIFRMTGEDAQAKDLTQDVFIKVYEQLGRFNFKNKFFSWIYRIAINETINFLKSRRSFEKLTALNEIRDEQPDHDLREVQRTKLHSAIRQLRADYRALILLKYFFGLSYEEIGEVMKIQEKTVKARLFMAREKLNSMLVTNKFFDHD
jgi:RNA polymerase sigma-70 factor, ECF subfamily